MADDGHLFDKYEDCVTYEYQKTVSEAELRLYDWDWKPIPTTAITEGKNYGYGADLLHKCRFVYLGNEAAIKIMKEICLDLNIDAPKRTGYWFLNLSENLWISLTDKIAELKKELEIWERDLKALQENK